MAKDSRLHKHDLMHGFSIVELSVVLVVMAVIVGAVVTASDLMRHAAGQRIFTDFVSNWKSAYIAYVAQTGHLPNDNPLAPTGKINQEVGKALCNASGGHELTQVMLSSGIELPSGRGPGKEDRYIYQDGDGVAHELQICLETVRWTVPGRIYDQFDVVNRHAIRLTGMTTELALQLDALIDGTSSPVFGKFRSKDGKELPHPTIEMKWDAVRKEVDESLLTEMTTYLLLN